MTTQGLVRFGQPIPPAVQQAVDALAMAGGRGYAVPKEISSAQALLDAIEAELNQRATTAAPPLPATAKAVPGALEAAAAEQATAAARGPIAEQWRATARNQLLDHVRAAVPGWVERLCDEFAVALDKFRGDVTGRANLGLDAQSLSTDQFATWRAATDEVNALDGLLYTRQTVFGPLLGEGGDYSNPHAPRSAALRFGPALPYLAVIKLPPPGTSRPEVLDRFKTRKAALEEAADADPGPRWTQWLAAEAEGWLSLSSPRQATSLRASICSTTSATSAPR